MVKICALCNEKEANKTNTHYLTDGIIRSCLNIDGSNDREKGLYYDLSNDSPFLEFGFQRNTPVDKLEDDLKRPATEEEIETAKKNPYSVDNVFCSGCEDKFTFIESEFISTVLPKLRSEDITGVTLVKSNSKLIRMFSILQIWRTYICTELYLNNETAERLRLLILNYPNIDQQDLSKFPLIVTYLQTLGGDKGFTKNQVGYNKEQNPNLILLNDFIIQFYEKNSRVSFFDFYGLNSPSTFYNTINYNEDEFSIVIFQNEDRKAFLKRIIDTRAKSSLDNFIKIFCETWFTKFGSYPVKQKIVEFVNELERNHQSSSLTYTESNIMSLINAFIEHNYN